MGDQDEELQDIKELYEATGHLLQRNGNQSNRLKYISTSSIKDLRNKSMEELIYHGAEELDGSLTNLIMHDKEGGIVIKECGRSITQLLAFLGSLIALNPSFPTTKTRIKNEVRFKEKIKDLKSVKTAEIYGRHGDRIFYEALKGENAKALMETHPEIAPVLGEMIGTALKEMEENGMYQRDSRAVNFIVDTIEDIDLGEAIGRGGISDKDLVLYVVDQEYSYDTKGTLNLNYLTAINSVQHLDRDVYLGFREAFEESYGDVSIVNHLIRNFVSPFHALLLERNTEWTRNSIANTYRDFVSWIKR